MSVRYNDLISDAQLEEAALKSMAGLTIASNQVAIQEAIRDTTDRFESFFDRFFIVRSFTQRIPINAWSYNRLLERYVAWASDKPIVEIKSIVDTAGSTISGTTVTREKSSPNSSYNWFATSTPRDCRVTYFSGYKRSDQALADLTGTGPGQGGLTTLTVTPDDLPSDVRRKAIELAMLYMRRALDGTLGSSSRMQQVGSQVVTVNAIDSRAEDKILESIAGAYKRRV